MGRGMEFLDGAGWMGFAGTKGEGPGAGQVYPGQGAEGEASGASMGEGTCRSGLVGRKKDTG